MVEKLLLNLMFTIAPTIIYSSLLENLRIKYNSVICGIFGGLASFLCMSYAYENYGLLWDLRYVTIILSFLYGGYLSGGVAVFIAIVGRALLSTSNLPFVYIECAITIIAPILMTNRFFSFEPSKRIRMAVLTGIWPLVVSYNGLLIYNWLQGYPLFSYSRFDLLFTGALFLFSIGICAKLNESVRERFELKDEIARAEKLNTLGELAASIAHEVRNPLTVVKGFLQLMQQEERGKNYEYLSIVLSELGRAESIINDYLNFAKPKFEKIEEFQLVDVIIETKILLEPLAVKKGVFLESELDGSCFYITTDRNQLKQALVNLIKNAIEATNDGGRVSICLKLKDNLASVFISDTGIGMTNEELSRIGTLFYTTKAKGTGLGTSVSVKIIETMKGKVTYKSEPGVGTEVTMILPGIMKTGNYLSEKC